jgi:hypothetical protein
MVNPPPWAHTLVVLVSLVGSLGVLMVYAVTRQIPPPDVTIMISALASGSSGSYFSRRIGETGAKGEHGDTGPIGHVGPTGPAAGKPGDSAAVTAAGNTGE